MKNFDTMEKVFNENQSSYKTLEYLKKDLVSEPNVKKLEMNIGMFEKFFNVFIYIHSFHIMF